MKSIENEDYPIREKEKIYTEEEILRGWLLSSLLNFTRYSFYQGNGGRRFEIGEHHRQIAALLDRVLRGELQKVIINIAPRYGKTVLGVHNFIAAGLALNPAAQFIHLSYSANLALENSFMIKKIVNSEWYRGLFGFAAGVNFDKMTRWDTSAGGGMYATSSLGQITGFGAGGGEVEGNGYRFGGAVVIDDPIKPDVALKDDLREQVNMHFETTIRNRANSRHTPIVIIMQRLHERDLCGYLQSIEPNEWTVLKIPCLSIGENGEETALWEYRHTVEELHRLRAVNQYVFDTQYQQDPRPLEGLMYSNLRTYQLLPSEPGLRKNYTDTADTGADYLCSICYTETATAMYITDILYTDQPMEFTEEETARMLLRERTQLVRIESNNGGRGFCRNVERKVRADYSDLARQMRFVAFSQTKNKQARIFTRSAEVQNLIYFPQEWQLRWPKFADAVLSYRKAGRNAHDDGPDALTGMTENFRKEAPGGMEVRLFRNRTRW